VTASFDARAAEVIRELARYRRFRKRLDGLIQPIPKGVYFFRCLEEADAQREAWRAIAIARTGR